MSNINLQIIRDLYDAYNNKNAERIFANCSTEIEILQTEQLAWGGFYKGFLEASTFFEKLVGNLNSKVEIENLIAAGDCVVAVGRTSGTVRKNGKPFDIPAVHVWTVREQKIVRFEAYIDTPAMLAVLT